MTYQESFALALKLKDFVRLYDEKAWIYFIFSSETEFSIKVFDVEPPYEISHQLQYDAYVLEKVPQAILSNIENSETFIYRDINVTVEFDLATNQITYFDGEENTPIDMEKVRKSLNQLLGKMK